MQGATYTATPVEGEVETWLVNAGGIGELNQKVPIGSAVSTVYSSIAVDFGGGDEPTSLDVSKIAEEAYTPYKVSATSVEGNIISLSNSSANPGVRLVYKVANSEEGAIQRDIVSGGGIDLWVGVPTGSTLGDVFEYIKAYKDTGAELLFTADLSTVVTDDLTIEIAPQTQA